MDNYTNQMKKIFEMKYKIKLERNGRNTQCGLIKYTNVRMDKNIFYLFEKKIDFEQVPKHFFFFQKMGV